MGQVETLSAGLHVGDPFDGDNLTTDTSLRSGWFFSVTIRSDAKARRRRRQLELVDEGTRTWERLPIAIQTRTPGPDHPDILDSKVGLDVVLYKQGRFEEAERLLVGALATSERTLGADHRNTLNVSATTPGSCTGKVGPMRRPRRRPCAGRWPGR